MSKSTPFKEVMSRHLEIEQIKQSKLDDAAFEAIKLKFFNNDFAYEYTDEGVWCIRFEFDEIYFDEVNMTKIISRLIKQLGFPPDTENNNVRRRNGLSTCLFSSKTPLKELL